MAHVTTIINQKGGTGKTTTAINLGSALARLNQRVLLIDLDPQANLSYSLAINEPLRTISDAIEGNCPLVDVLHQRENMFVAPAAIDLADTELALIDQPGRENFLYQRLIESPGPSHSRTHNNLLQDFDHILIDSPPSLSVLAINALNASHHLLIPMQLEVLSLRGLSQLLATVEEFKRVFEKHLNILGVLIVKYNARIRLFGEVKSYIKQNFHEHLFKAAIRDNIRIAEAPSFGQSVVEYSPRSHGAKDYMALAKEFLKIIDTIETGG